VVPSSTLSVSLSGSAIAAPSNGPLADPFTPVDET
jgi:hypothetical protein